MGGKFQQGYNINRSFIRQMQARVTQQKVEIPTKSCPNQRDLFQGENLVTKKPTTLNDEGLSKKPRRPSNKQTIGKEKQPTSSVSNSNPALSTLKELFPGWSDDDLGIVLQETNQDLEVAIVRISEGRVKPFSQVSKGKKVTVTQQPAFSSTPHARGRFQSSGGNKMFKEPRTGKKQQQSVGDNLNSSSTSGKDSQNEWINEVNSNNNCKQDPSSTSGWIADKATEVTPTIPMPKTKQEEDLSDKTPSQIKPDWSRIVGRRPSEEKSSFTDKREKQLLADIGDLSLEEKITKESSILPAKPTESRTIKPTQPVSSLLPSNPSSSIEPSTSNSSAQTDPSLGKNATLIGSVAPPPGGLVAGSGANMSTLYAPSSLSTGPTQGQGQVAAASTGFPSAGGFPPSNSNGPRYANAQTITDLYLVPGGAPGSFGYQMPPPYAAGFYNPYFYAHPTNPYAPGGVPPQLHPQYSNQQLMPGSGQPTAVGGGVSGGTTHSSKLLSHYNSSPSSASSPSSSPYSPTAHYGMAAGAVNNHGSSSMYNPNQQGKFMGGMSGNPSNTIGIPHQFQSTTGQSSFYPQTLHNQQQQTFSPTSPGNSSAGNSIIGSNQQFDSHIPLNPYYHHQPISGAHHPHHPANQNMHPNFYSTLPLMPPLGHHQYHPAGHMHNMSGGAASTSSATPGQQSGNPSAPSTSTVSMGPGSHRANNNLLTDKENTTSGSTGSNSKNYWTMSQ